MENQTIGQALMDLRKRSGLSLRDVARGAGYRSASGVQSFFQPHYDPIALDVSVAIKLAAALEGKGSPPIRREEVIALARLPEDREGEPVPVEIFRPSELSRDVPVYGSALGAPVEFIEGTVEQIVVQEGEVIDYFKRPPSLQGREDVYGFYVAGVSMEPRFEEGGIALVDAKRPPQINDDVVVYLYEPCGDGERLVSILLKRLVRRTADKIVLRQFNPDMTFEVERQRVRHMHRIFRIEELLA